MANVTDQGISNTLLSAYKEKLESIFIDAFGKGFNVDPETAQGQLIGQLALMFSEIDSHAIEMFNATDIYNAVGKQIDYIASNIGITRKEAIKSQVEAELTGKTGVTIPQGALAEDKYGNVFVLQNSATFVAGKATGTFIAEKSGNIRALAGTLTKIKYSLAGWDSINNKADGIPGRAAETDAEFRTRYLQSVHIKSSGKQTSIYSRLMQTDGVVDALVVYNDKDVADTKTTPNIPPHSISCVVYGGDENAIVEAIAQTKPIGISLNGNVIQSYSVSSAQTIDVKFYRPTQVNIHVKLKIKYTKDFPSDGEEQVKQNLVNFFNGFKINESVSYSRVYMPINAVAGHQVESLTIGKTSNAMATQNIPINLTEIARLNYNNIEIEASFL